MRKEEFLEKLRARLSQTMSQQEVTAQIRYYENYIQEQIQNGRSEEEVLTELGDPLLIAKTLAHLAIDQGADLVVGHHPHVLQGIEKYQGKNIVYSLGNFCFGGNKNPSDKDTMIFQQTFTVENGKLAEDDVTNIIPCSLSSESGYNNYQPMVLEGSEKERVLQKIEDFSTAINQ